MTLARHDRLGPTRAAVLHLLREADGDAAGVSAAEVARALGLHANTTRFHLDALAAAGLVLRELEQRTQPGRPRVLYRARDSHRGNPYHDLAGAMVRHFAGNAVDRPALAREAGVAWGVELRADRERLAPAESSLCRLVGCLADLGYAPELEEGQELLVVLRPCPYADLAAEDPAVVCELHLGLMRGVLGEDQGLAVASLLPWVTPTRCEVHLEQVMPGAAGDVGSQGEIGSGVGAGAGIPPTGIVGESEVGHG
jgi:predicted ArsR family transcriptional regulator